MTITNNKYFAIVGLIVFFFSFGALIATNDNVQSFFGTEVFALGTGGCGSCGGDDPTGGGDGGGDSSNPPVCDLSTNLEFVEAGEQYTLSWNNSSNGTYELGGVAVEPTGYITFTWDPNNVFLTFTLTGSNSDGTCSDSVTVYRQVDVPTCEITSNISAVEEGGQFTISWVGTPNHSTVFRVNNTIVDPVDSVTYTFPEGRTTPAVFTMTGNNAKGECSDQVTVVPKGSEVPGCTDDNADNYNPNATTDDGSCVYTPPKVCTDFGFDFEIAKWDIDGSTFTKIKNPISPYTISVSGNENSISWTASPAVDGVLAKASTDHKVFSGGTSGTVSKTKIGDGTHGLSHIAFCGYDTIPGCTDADADNYNPNATTDDGSCTYTIPGCTDADALNYNPNANYDDGSCVYEPEAPVCVSFTASDTSLPVGGGNVTLTWDTENAARVVIDNNIGTVSADGSKVVAVTDDITYKLTASNADGSDANICPVTITVADPEPEKDPITCEDNVTFTANPASHGVGGGMSTLSWTTTDIETVLLNDVQVALNSAQNVNVTEDTIYTLKVTGDNTTTGNTVSCPVAITVETAEPNPPTCSDVSFTASDTSVREGSKVTLAWVFTGNVDTASIDNGIGSVQSGGSTEVTVNNDITYRITLANDDGNVSCPLSLNAESGGGGGGGGSSSPRCDLDISDSRITLGDEITLTWETSRATEVTIEDNHGNIIVTTEDKLSRDKDEFYDGEITLKPKEDTTYTLTAERGSRDRECEVSVDVRGGVTVHETRTQDPRVAGISLTTVPYTGFDAGPALTIIFYTILTLWALFVAYVVVIRRDSIAGVSLAGSHEHVPYTEASVDEVSEEVSEAESYVHTAAPATQTIPANLPVATAAAPAPAIGYASHYAATPEEVTSEESENLTVLENHAHEARTLLSSDAMRHLVHMYGSTEESLETLDAVIAKAKITFPSEDGWVVINLSRLEELLAQVA